MEKCCASRPSKNERRMARQTASKKILRKQGIAEEKARLVDAQPEPELQPDPEPEKNYPDSYTGYTGHYGQGLRKLDEPPSPTQSKTSIISILIDRVIIDEKILEGIRKKYENNKDKPAVYPFSSYVAGASRASRDQQWGSMVKAYGNEINNIINGNATKYSEYFPLTNIDKGIKMFGHDFYEKLVEHWGIDLLEELIEK